MALCCIRGYPDVEELKRKAEEILRKRGYNIDHVDVSDDPSFPVRFWVSRPPKDAWEKAARWYKNIPATVVVYWHRVAPCVAYFDRAELEVSERDEIIVIPLASA